MELVKITSDTTSLTFNGSLVFPKNALVLDIYSAAKIKIKTVYNGVTIIDSLPLSAFINSSGVAYTSLDTFIADFKTAAYK